MVAVVCSAEKLQVAERIVKIGEIFVGAQSRNRAAIMAGPLSRNVLWDSPDVPTDAAHLPG